MITRTKKVRGKVLIPPRTLLGCLKKHMKSADMSEKKRKNLSLRPVCFVSSLLLLMSDYVIMKEQFF